MSELTAIEKIRDQFDFEQITPLDSGFQKKLSNAIHESFVIAHADAQNIQHFHEFYSELKIENAKKAKILIDFDDSFLNWESKQVMQHDQLQSIEFITRRPDEFGEVISSVSSLVEGHLLAWIDESVTCKNDDEDIEDEHREACEFLIEESKHFQIIKSKRSLVIKMSYMLLYIIICLRNEKMWIEEDKRQKTEESQRGRLIAEKLDNIDKKVVTTIQDTISAIIGDKLRDLTTTTKKLEQENTLLVQQVLALSKDVEKIKKK